MDCYMQDPVGNVIYRETKKQYDSFTHRAEVKGVYQFCFSNEFSTFSHKTVYFDFQVGDEPPILPDMGNRVTALTQVSGRDSGSTRGTLLLSASSCFSVPFLGTEQESPSSSKTLHFPSGPVFSQNPFIADTLSFHLSFSDIAPLSKLCYVPLCSVIYSDCEDQSPASGVYW